MSIWKPFRKLYIKTTNLTQGYQGKDSKLNAFYKAWSYCYDFSVGLDPAFGRELQNMISASIKEGDRTLDIGCGTGMSTFPAAEIAKRVVAIDLSVDMLRKLKRKVEKKKITNIEIIHGRFPDDLPNGIKFDSIISSYAIVHFTPEQRKKVYKDIFDLLVPKGRLGLFAAQGEIARSFETKAELLENLKQAGFLEIRIQDVSDIYRIVTAQR